MAHYKFPLLLLLLLYDHKWRTYDRLAIDTIILGQILGHFVNRAPEVFVGSILKSHHRHTVRRQTPTRTSREGDNEQCDDVRR